MNHAGFLTQDALSDLLFYQAPIGIVCCGLDGSILRANPAFCRLIGYTESQLHRLDNRSISHPEDFAAEFHLIQQMIDQGLGKQTFTKRYLGQHGTIVWAEVSLSLVGELDAEDSYLLAFVTDLSDRKRAEQEIEHRRAREYLLNEIAAQLRTTFDLQSILQLAVSRLRDTLQVDRVLAYQFFPDDSGVCLAEAVDFNYPSLLGEVFPPECIPPPHLNAYRMGRLWAVTNVCDETLSPCHHQMLEQICVRSMMAIGIVSMDENLEPQKRKLWGLLALHHCRVPRQWTPDEQQLVQAVANQLAIALEQISLFQELRRYTYELEDRVSQRTHSLEQALKFERLIHRLTEALRTNLDEDQMLQAAVEGLVQTLAVDGCIASLFDPNRHRLEIRHECFSHDIQAQRSLVGQALPLQDWSVSCYEQLLNQQTFLCHLPEDEGCWVQSEDPRVVQEEVLRSLAPLNSSSSGSSVSPSVSKVMSPIVDDQGLIGLLTVFHTHPRTFEPAEIHLIEQVASQCAIALRQAHLHRQEHKQRLSAGYFRSFLEQSNDVFVEYDAELRYVSINPTGSALLGKPPSEIIGKTNRELLGLAAEPLELLIRRVLETGERVFVDHEITLPHGVRVLETSYAPITNPAGKVQRVIGVCRDITDLKWQWQLLETQNHKLAEATRLKEEFIATTSHELRTPLTAILGFSNVLLQEFFGGLNAKQKDYVERIQVSGQHLLELINDILDLSRLEAERLDLDLQTIFVPDICEGAICLVQEQAQNQGLELKVELDPDIDWLVADARRLKQMLLNLLTNAVKFTQSGAVGLKVYRQRQPQGYSLPRQKRAGALGDRAIPAPGDTINFLVWDTGVGIDEADQPLLFSPFSQINNPLAHLHQGTGLGLVITRKLAELHGGTVTLESSQNQGARFTISLPLRLPHQ